MSALAISEIPHAQSSDGDEVRTALEVAEACWRNGDFDESVRWLRRASQAAAQADHLARAMELSKWVADALKERAEETQPGPRSGIVPAGTTIEVPPPPPLPQLSPELAAPEDEDEDDEPTLVRRIPVPLPHEGPETLAFDASLVALRRSEGRIEVIPLAPGGVAPPGSAVVMMVASSDYDADLLARWLD